MEDPLLKFTNDTYAKITVFDSTLVDMNLNDLSKYLTGLRIYKTQLTLHMQDVK